MMALPPVRGLCEACAKSEPLPLGENLVIACPHHEAVAIFYPEMKMWLTASPVTLAAFLNSFTAHQPAKEAAAAQVKAPTAGERH